VLVDLVAKDRYFNGFDEVWFADTLDVQEVPDDLRYGFIKWWSQSNFSLALGDGTGLNCVCSKAISQKLSF
jgi:hypothetical protein